MTLTPRATKGSKLTIAELDAVFNDLQTGNFNDTDFNTKLGYQAGLNIVSGAQYNTFLGYKAGTSSSTLSTNAADYNTGIGYQVLYSNTIGYQNTANGVYALYANTIGYYNSAMGMQTLYSNTTGYSNTAMGMYALYSNTGGYNNTANGMSSLYSNTTGYNNTANGANALLSNTTGYYNTANGMSSLYDLGIAQTAGSFNVVTSYTIKTIGTTDFTLIGASANTVGIVFTATGVGSGTGTATPNGTSNNTALGYNTGRGIIYGTGNTILGANVTGLAAGLTNNIILANGTGAIKAQHDGTNWSFTGNVGVSGTPGFSGTAPVAKPTITGSRGGNAALASLLTALAATGLLTDSSTA